MGIDNLSVVDAISLDPQGFVVLTIFDGWDWIDEGEHLLLIQEKINLYFGFIQTGQVVENYPEAAGKKIHINHVMANPLPPQALELLRRANVAAAQLDVKITHKVSPFKYDPTKHQNA